MKLRGRRQKIGETAKLFTDSLKEKNNSDEENNNRRIRGGGSEEKEKYRSASS